MTGGRLTRAMLGCGLVVGPAFLGAAAIQGRRRAGYVPRRHPISSLAIGPRGHLQIVNFTAAGLLCTAFAAGLARRGGPAFPRSEPALIAVTAAGLLACAPFRADPVNGYPPGTPLTPEVMTRAGYTHLVASSVVMVGVPATMANAAWHAWRRGERRWAGFSAVTTALAAASFAGACAGFAQVWRLPSVAGALQRSAVATGFAWLAARGIRALRSDTPQ